MIAARILAATIGTGLMLALAGCTGLPAPKQQTPGVAHWSSSKDGARKLAAMPPIALESTAASGPDTVTVDPAQRFQSMTGFGAAMTDASAQLIESLPPERRNALLDDLFAPAGLGLSLMRLPIGASDFSAEHYSLDDVAPGQVDPEFRHFSLTRSAAQIAASKAAIVRNPRLVLMASPWSAPAWMKTSGSLIKGSLDPAHYADFARYLDRYLAVMEREGLPIAYLTIQNEPDFEPADYPGMRVDPAGRAALIGQHLGPLLKQRQRRTRILDWDHNWDKPENPLAVLADPRATRYVAGVAWHCYGGSVAAQAAVQARYPAKENFLTECSGGGWAPDWGGSLGWMTSELIIGASRGGSRGSLLWNLALDEASGPHKGGCGNCRGVVTIDRRSGAVTHNVEYYVLAHASRFVKPGARRIASDQKAGIVNVAWRNPDGAIVLLAHNPGSGSANLQVRAKGGRFSTNMPSGEVSTFVWQP